MELLGRLAALAWPAAFKPEGEPHKISWGVLTGPHPANSKLRKHVVSRKPVEERESPKPKVYSMTWAQGLKRVFSIEIEKCEKCGGKVKIIASIEERNVAPPEVIEKILEHLELDKASQERNRSPPAGLFDLCRANSYLERNTDRFILSTCVTSPDIFII